MNYALNELVITERDYYASYVGLHKVQTRQTAVLTIIMSKWFLSYGHWDNQNICI